MPKLLENIELKEYSNYRIGGPARFFIEAKNREDILFAISEAKEKKLPIFILGGGTNILIRDIGFNGLVIKPCLDFIEKQGEDIFSVSSGVLISKLLDYSMENSLSGLEWAGGLPGTFGGAVYGNAGAFKGETKDSVVEVESLEIESGNILKRNNQECCFGYRSSIFKEKNGKPVRRLPEDSIHQVGGEIILYVNIRLTKGDTDTIRKEILEKIDYRKEKHPLEYPNIGSIFKNPTLENIPVSTQEHFKSFIKSDPFPVIPAARIISEAGLKGKSINGAMISPKHPNFIVNMYNASSEDVLGLIDLVKKEVKNKFDLYLEEEVQII